MFEASGWSSDRVHARDDAIVRVPPVPARRDGWHPRPWGSLRSLAQVAHTGAGTLSVDEALSALETLQRERAALDALEAELLVRAAGAEKVTRDVLVDPDPADPSFRPRRVEMVDEVVDEIAVVLHRAPGTVRGEVATARLLHGPLRATRDALAAGAITAGHARQIAEQAARLQSPKVPAPGDDEAFAAACARLQDRVLSHARTETVSQTRARARRVVASIDPDGIAARRRRARCTREVRGWGEDDGIGVVQARLAGPDAAWVIASIDAHARKHVNDDRFDLHPDATWGEVRAAAFVDLLKNPTADGSTAAAGVGVELQILIDLPTLTGLTPSTPASTTVGPDRVDVDRGDLAGLLDRLGDAPVAVRRLVTDPLTGALIDHGAARYTPSSALVAWLRARDQHCRFPGCTRPAIRCDVDHATDYADGGGTTVANTGLFCRRHHNGKTHGDWQIEDSQPDGSCTLISPTGHRYFHQPVALIEPRTDAADPDPPPQPEPKPEPPPF